MNHVKSASRWRSVPVWAVLLLGFAAYAGAEQLQPRATVMALLAATAAMLALVALNALQRLRVTRTQYLQALDSAAASEIEICRGRRHEGRCPSDQEAQRREAALRAEMLALREKKQELMEQAYHDGLTGLANRRLLIDRFQLAVERAKRSGAAFALMMVDLDHFKQINDRYGHGAGDVVLVAAARRLVSGLRASDTVSRIGGDEFVLVVEAFDSPRHLKAIANKLIQSLSDPVTLEDGLEVSVGASAGWAVYPQDGQELNELLDLADHQMYECKTSGLAELT